MTMWWGVADGEAGGCGDALVFAIRWCDDNRPGLSGEGSGGGQDGGGALRGGSAIHRPGGGVGHHIAVGINTLDLDDHHEVVGGGGRVGGECDLRGTRGGVDRRLFGVGEGEGEGVGADRVVRVANLQHHLILSWRQGQLAGGDAVAVGGRRRADLHGIHQPGGHQRVRVVIRVADRAAKQLRCRSGYAVTVTVRGDQRLR